MGHSLSSYWLIIRAMARSQMQYRLNFAANIASMVLTYGAQFVSLYWITQRFQSVGGWRLEDIVLLYGLAIIAWGFCVSIFGGLMGFEEQVRNGTFDRALLRPMNPLLHALGSQSPIAGMGQFVFSVAALVFAFRAAHVRLTVVKLIYLVLTALGGGLILGAAMVTVATIAFWTTRTYTFYWSIVFPSRQLINYPVSIYHRSLQVILTVAVPFAFINYFPAHVLLDRTRELPYPIVGWATPVVGLLAFTPAYLFWNFGTRYYTGTGS